MKYKKNLLFISPDAPPSIGGVEKFISMISVNIPRDEFNITILSGTRLNGDVKKIKFYLWSGIQVVQIPTFNFKGMEWPAKLVYYKEIWRLLRWADTVHLNDVRCFFTTTVLARIFNDSKLILTTHGLIFHTRRNMLAKNLYALYFRQCMKFAIDKVIVNGYVDQFYCQNFNVETTLINNGVDIDSWTKFCRKPIAGNFIYFGRIDKNKGLSNLIRVLSLYKRHIGGFRLDICGGGDENEVLKLKEEADNLGVSNFIFWHGRVTDKELKDLLSHSELVFNPSTFESFGLALVEAALMGCTIIANKNKQFDNMVGNSKAVYLIDFHNKVEFFDVIKRIRMEYQDTREVAIIWSKRYGQTQFIQHYLDVYREY